MATNTFCFTKTFDGLDKAIESVMKTSRALAESDLEALKGVDLEDPQAMQMACNEVETARSAALGGGDALWTVSPEGVHYRLVRIDEYPEGRILVFTTISGKDQIRFALIEGEVTAVYRVYSRHAAGTSSAVMAFTAAGWQRCDFMGHLFAKEEAMKQADFGPMTATMLASASKDVYDYFGGVDPDGVYDPQEYSYEGDECGGIRPLAHMGRGWH